MSNQPLITVVCPVHNEEPAVPLFYQRIQTVLAPLRAQYRFELLFTNNCSTDGTRDAILKLRDRDPNVQILSLSRNFGYEASIATGLRYAAGDAVIQIDVDCEDPPEMIPEFLKEWQAGHDVVYGRRDQRQEFVGTHLARKMFYRLSRLLADTEMVLDMGNFYLLSAAARDAVTANRSTLPFVRSEVAYAGFRRKGIPYQRQRRTVGETHFNFPRMIRFALAGILSSSTFPLRFCLYAFPLLVAVNAILLTMDRLPWLVAVDLLFLSLGVGIVSIYLARIYKDVVQRPIAVIDWRQSRYNHAEERGVIDR